MKIIFFNTLHNGDLLFTKEYIRSIVKANPEHTFSIACRQFYSAYSDIKNLEILQRPNNIDHRTTSKDIDTTKTYYIMDGALYINSGLAVNHGTIESPQVEWFCNINVECINKYFSDIIKGANTLEIEPKLVFNPLSEVEFIPTVLDGFTREDIPLKIQSALATPCIFYYNMKNISHSNTVVDDDKNIEAIAQKYPTYKVICAKETRVKIDNVLSLHDEKIKESEDGKNLLVYAYIASYCPIIVSKDTGGAQTIFNTFTIKSKITQYIIMFYSEEMNQTISKNYGLSFVDSIKKLLIHDNKHLIPLSVYDSESLLGEIEKIGPISPPNLELVASGGRRALYRTKKNKLMRRINKRYRGLANRTRRRRKETHKVAYQTSKQ